MPGGVQEASRQSHMDSVTAVKWKSSKIDLPDAEPPTFSWTRPEKVGHPAR